MKLRNTAIAAALSLVPLGQPLAIGTGAALTSSALILSAPNKTQAMEPMRAKDSQGRTMKFYIDRGIEKIRNGDRLGGNADYTTAINLHERDPFGADLYYYQFALSARGISRMKLGNKSGGCFDFQRAEEFGSEKAKKLFLKYCHLKPR